MFCHVTHTHALHPPTVKLRVLCLLQHTFVGHPVAPPFEPGPWGVQASRSQEVLMHIHIYTYTHYMYTYARIHTCTYIHTHKHTLAGPFDYSLEFEPLLRLAKNVEKRQAGAKGCAEAWHDSHGPTHRPHVDTSHSLILHVPAARRDASPTNGDTKVS